MRDAIAKRAKHLCEYCRFPESEHPEPFEIEHIIAKKHGGDSSPGNLAWACLPCNRHKGSDLAGLYRIGRRRVLVRLFNPRRNRWTTHFEWASAVIRGKSRIGKVTVQVLWMNDPDVLLLRMLLIGEGHHFAS